MSNELMEMNLAAKTDGNPNRVFLKVRGKYVPFIREVIPEPDIEIEFDHDGVRIEKVTIDFQKQVEDTARRIAANFETSVLSEPTMIKALAARGFVQERTCHYKYETHWAPDDDTMSAKVYECSRCGYWEPKDEWEKYGGFAYCPGCGAKVVNE